MSEKIDKILAAFLSDYPRKLHVRQIARLIDMNRQTVSETLKAMEQERVLESEVSGRQKLYFINSRNPKAKMLVQNAENMKRLGMCENILIARLVEYLDPISPAVLFGSYAKGTERKGSDIDLLIVSARHHDFEAFEKETGRIVQAFQMGRKGFMERFFRKDHLVIEIVKDHVCLRNIEGFVDMLWEANYGKGS